MTGKKAAGAAKDGVLASDGVGSSADQGRLLRLGVASAPSLIISGTETLSRPRSERGRRSRPKRGGFVAYQAYTHTQNQSRCTVLSALSF